MTDARAFRGFRFPAEVILWAVRWYLQFPISYRDLERMLADRGVQVDHVSLFRWVQRFAPELEKRLRRHLRPCRGPWHVDETFVRVGGSWRYLYRAVDGTGQTIDFLLSATRDKRAAKRFFRRALARENTRHPRTVVTDRLKSYPGALREMKREGELGRFVRHRRGRWLNNRVEQDPSPDQAPDPPHARLSGLLDGQADAGRGGGDGDAGQGTSARRARQRHAGAAGLRPPGLRSRRMSGPAQGQARPRHLNATEPLFSAGQNSAGSPETALFLSRNSWSARQQDQPLLRVHLNLGLRVDACRQP
jgi:transposase-like protein